jgi:CRISPR/Cas system-associated protein endoribonuclease Cas2
MPQQYFSRKKFLSLKQFLKVGCLLKNIRYIKLTKGFYMSIMKDNESCNDFINRIKQETPEKWQEAFQMCFFIVNKRLPTQEEIELERNLTD